jgi:hypothetical protein
MGRRGSVNTLMAANTLLSQKVNGMWANITEVSRKRELEAENRQRVEAAHEDMVEQYARAHARGRGRGRAFSGRSYAPHAAPRRVSRCCVAGPCR